MLGKKKAEKKKVPQLEDWQKRVVLEKNKLDKKIVALAKFKEADKFTNLQPEDRENLSDQLGYMKRYAATLNKRMEKFAKK